MLTLGQAARLTGTSKMTLTRAIKGGKLSAARQDDGTYRIDPAELAHVYMVTPAPPETGTAAGEVVRRATGQIDAGATPATPGVEAQLQSLKELVAELRQSREPVWPSWKRLAG